MLERIGLKNFKGARGVEVRLSPLTVLCGLNSAGKSTILQCLSAIRQSAHGARRLSSFDLHGELVQLGVLNDVLSHGAEDEVLEVSLQSSSGSWSARFSGELSESSLHVLNQIGEVPQLLTRDNFQLLLAERISPQVRFPRDMGNRGLAGRLGARGEYTADVLAKLTVQSTRVPKSRHVSEVPYGRISRNSKASPTDKFPDQLSAWLQEFSPGVRLESEAIALTDDVRLSYSYFGRSGFEETSEKIRPTNVGFGLTYSLPVVAAGLLAEPGSLLLLENPEAHLHPRGQLYLGFLLSQITSDNVQVVVETHSDHVVNGIRLAVKGGVVGADLVGFRFFSRDMASGNVNVECPVVLSDGSIPAWPEGFFDEWDNALMELLRP